MRVESNYVALFLSWVFLTACAGPAIAPGSNTLSSEVLLRAEPLTGAEDVPVLDDIDILALNENMRTFLRKHVPRELGRTLKLHELVYAIITEGSFGLQYDESTRTAQETFEARHGNCLSFTNMFVAMAREIGLRVNYQEIEIPPSWTMEGGVYVLTRHVNAVVDLGGGGVREVDFNIDDFQSSYSRQPISDQRAHAHYYSNIGAEYLQQSDYLTALRYFRKAAAVDERFSVVWSNLGALYSRTGHLDYAEAAYIKALTLNPLETVAMSNLGRLYDHLGKSELGEWYSRRSNRHRMRNPYYRYHLAREAYLAKDYEAAIKHLKFSVKEKKNEDTFYILMGLSHLGKGDESTARHWLEKAEQLASDDGLKRNYHSKLEKLLDAG